MPARTHRTPSYRLHKPSGLAVVTLAGRDVYLEKHGSPESLAEYDRVVAEWLASGRQAPQPAGAAAAAGPAGDLTVAELILAYVQHAEAYYRKGDEVTSEVRNIKLALRPLRRLYGHTPARSFGPLALKAVRQALVDSRICRNEVNKRVRHVVRAFKWAVENELTPPAVHQALKAVAGLRAGRSEARETEPVRPAREAHVDAIRPHVNGQVWAMVELQRLTGMRPGEVVRMRTIDIDVSGRVWTYTPERHKTEHHGRPRVVYLGPRAQEILRPWLRPELTAYLFSPLDALEEHFAARRAARKTPMTPSQRARRRVPRREREIGPRYTPDSYRSAIAKACDRAGVPGWHTSSATTRPPGSARNSGWTWPASSSATRPPMPR